MLAVYMDQHVPTAITDGLRSRGINGSIAELPASRDSFAPERQKL